MSLFPRTGLIRTLVVLIAVGTMLAAGPPPTAVAEPAGSGVAAIVDGQAISVFRVREAAARAAGPAVLDQLIGDALIHQEARRRHIGATSSEVDAEILHIRQLIKPASLEDSLRSRHTSPDEMRNQIRVQIELGKMIGPSSEVQLAREAPGYVQSLRRKSRVIVYMGGSPELPAGIAAMVNGQPIASSKVEDIAYRMAGESIVRHMIDLIVVDQEARRQKIVVGSAEVDAKIQTLQQSMGPKAFTGMLKQQGMSLTEFRETVRTEIESHRLVWKAMGPLKMAHVHHIFLLTNTDAAGHFPGAQPHTDAEARSLMASIQAQIQAGKNFDDLAREYSDDTASKAKGGDLGVAQPELRFGGEIFQAASTLKRGAITPQPVELNFGLHLIMAVSTLDDHPKTEDALYARSVDYIHMQELQVFLRPWLQYLRGKSKIVDYLADDSWSHPSLAPHPAGTSVTCAGAGVR